MQVSNPNNVKIYNLSTGKSLPEWLTDRKKRLLQKKDADVRHRIQLIQDFEMPCVSDCIRMSSDGQYIFATGIYKPRVKCYEVSQMSMKFERCFDAEVIKFLVLSEDYTKLVFLQCDRYVEFHVQYGKYYRIRIPRFGRDMAYLPTNCDLYFVGDSPEVYRLNLEQGRFLNSLKTGASAINACAVNEQHNLILLGTQEGKVEAWDPRTRNRVGVLECALNSVTEETEVFGMPSVTSLEFRDALNLGVGTATGQILLFDIRASKPTFVKDHMYGLPIKNIKFHNDMDMVISMDRKVVKIWERVSGKAFTAITPPSDLNDLCVVKNSGLLFLANEDVKILTYYIPSLGPAPKWCSFIDNLTEELEETNHDTVYDDYKFVTKKELDDLGLSHLVGSNLLRAYMHGYFLDIKLYHRAKSIAQPFAYEEYRKKKIKEKIEETRKNRVQKANVPPVNKELAQRLMDKAEDIATKKNSKKKQAPNLLEDTRFKALFENPDFEVDPTSEEYRLLHPIVAKIGKPKKQRKQKQPEALEQFEMVDDQSPAGSSSSEEEDSSDDDRTWTEEVKQQHRLLRREAALRQKEEDLQARLKPKMYELKSGVDFSGLKSAKSKNKTHKLALGERLESESTENIQSASVGGNRVMTFSLKKAKEKDREEQTRQHMEERKKLRRSVKGLKLSAIKKGGL